MNEQFSVLFVDDEYKIRKAIERSMKHQIYNRHFAENSKEALKIMKEYEIAVIVADIHLPGVDGVELLKIVEKLYPNTVRIALTGVSDINSVYDILDEVDLYKYYTKPWNVDDLKKTILEGVEIYYQSRA